MILAHGILYPDSELPRLRDTLAPECADTITAQSIRPEWVVAACDTLARRARQGRYDEMLAPFLQAAGVSRERFEEALTLFERPSLEYKLAAELGGEGVGLSAALPPLLHPDLGQTVLRQRRRLPLGVLLHIAAGNMDGLPAYSVVEGLLAGNINVLKLPSADSGGSILLLKELVEIEPRLRDFVYVFDVPSSDLASLAAFAAAADGVVVWGGDEAVRAARQLAAPDTRLIEWGHKLSFAYLTPDASDEDLRALAAHICETRQLLCSSCQGIFCDTGDMAEVNALAQRFFALLHQQNAQYPPAPLPLRAKAALQLYTGQLEAAAQEAPAAGLLLRADGIGVFTAPDSRLELSPLGGHCWLKPLPRQDIVAALKPYKGRLQTAGLLCREEDRAPLAALLAKAGVVRVTRAAGMSRTLAGEAHDGLYALRLYTRVVEWDG